MTDMVFTRNLNFLRKILTNAESVKSYLSKFTDDELYHTNQNMNNIIADLIKCRESKHEKLNVAINKLIDELKKDGMNDEEVNNFINELTISDTDNNNDSVDKRRKFNKNNKFSVKYRAVTIDETGEKKVYSWTGVGRRPNFFKNLSEDELEKYNISPNKTAKLPVMYRAVEIKEGKEIIHTWSGVGNRSPFFSKLTPSELEKYKV
ncbi:hypothetical protein [Xenorhabdus sp. KJ12.1]|uniref:hypothetical protein n=1 Tax=Xenorhabdus sp. KJ12.1 TaxID=1851571 RepID=UPI000C038C3E|nr:hypothetical protein [Xenorhabdus sp. KJ12.1]PHM67999.1 hypothetical protein Xekj_03722 [Xenorhabdus sp. KJ12.1]